MRDDLIPPFLAALGTKVESQTAKFASARCPMAPWLHSKGTDGHPSFGVSRGTRHNCKCLACGFAGPLDRLVFEIRRHNSTHPSGYPYRFAKALEILEQQAADDPLLADDDFTLDQWLSQPPPGLHVFPEHYLDGFEAAYTETAVHPYLEERAVNCTTARRLDLRWDAWDERVCFPVRDLQGRLCGVHGRAVGDKQPTYRVYRHQEKSNTQVWLGEHWLDFDKPVLVVESVFDLARVYPLWPNVITPRTANYSAASLKRLDGITHAVSLFDNDKAGDQARATFDQLQGASITHLSPAPFKDPGECPEDFLASLLSHYRATTVFSS